jgi:hypothetical protein
VSSTDDPPLRFLSPEWFAAVRAAETPNDHESSSPTVVMGQVVRDTPFGDVHYTVEIRDGSATLIGPDADDAGTEGADEPVVLTITSDWNTACALASGQLSTERALMEAKLRVRGDLDALGPISVGLRGLDPLPAAVRALTSFE